MEQEANRMVSEKLPNPVLSPERPAPVQETACGFCDLLCPTPRAVGAHPESPHFFTEREVKLLERMLEARSEIQKLRRRMRQIQEDLATQRFVKDSDGKKWREIRRKLWTQSTAEDMLFLTDRLTRLSEEWERMDRERVEAAGERMLLLVHPAQ
jgi:hypothetical protein